MTRQEALWKVTSAIQAFGLSYDEYAVCPEAVRMIRALEALGLIKFDDGTMTAQAENTSVNPS